MSKGSGNREEKKSRESPLQPDPTGNQPIHEQPHPSASDSASDQERQADGNYALQRRIALATVWMAVFTGLLFVGNGLTIYYMHAALVETRASNEGAHRAWLIVRRLHSGNAPPQPGTGDRPGASDQSVPAPAPVILGPDLIYTIWIEVENAGASPAREILNRADSRLIDRSEEEFFQSEPHYRMPNTKPSKSLIGPKHSQWIPLRMGPFRADDVRSIVDRTRRIFLFGRLDYLDTFSRERVTKFCATFNPVAISNTGVVSGTFDFCGRYNEAH